MSRKFGDRKDGTYLKNISSMHAIMPLMYPNRCDNEAYISERIDLTAIIYFLTDSYAAGNKPRAIFIFLIGLSLLLVPSLLNPVAKPDTTVLLAIPSALTVPFLLVRVHHLPALLLYLLLLAGSVAIIILQ